MNVSISGVFNTLSDIIDTASNDDLVVIQRKLERAVRDYQDRISDAQIKLSRKFVIVKAETEIDEATLKKEGEQLWKWMKIGRKVTLYEFRKQARKMRLSGKPIKALRAYRGPDLPGIDVDDEEGGKRGYTRRDEE